MVETNKNTSTVDPGIKPAEYVEFIEVVETDEIQIPIDEAFAAAGVLNEGLNHALLHNRDLADQHPIEAITELRDELDEIERLKTVYSNMAGFANYYKWNDGAYDEYGYFVSLAPHTSFIEICNGQDIFGVTVPHAAFVGNQDQSAPRDNTYALVVTSGFVEVRCESDVVVGDCVVSNSVGVAEKTASQSGYKVIAIDNSTGVNYATIALGVQACTTDLLDKNTQKLDERVEKVETNVIAAMNAANAAHNMAQNVTNSNNVMSGQVSGALEKVESMEQQVGDLTSQVGNIAATSAQAQAVAQSASTSAEASRLAAVKAADESLAGVNDLIDKLTPITTWDDPTGTRGAEYLTTYIKDGVATKVEVQTVEKLTEENKSAIEESAEFFSRTLSSVDKYSVGEYSQSYGLTYEQAKSILTEGMVYIPTKNFFSCCEQHKNVGIHCETFSDIEDSNKAKNEFTPGYYYEWSTNENGEIDWLEGIGRVVFFHDEVPGQSGNLKYWYIDSNTAPEGYEPYALYIWEDDQWIKVNILEGNANNRISSAVKQTVDGVSTEIANARGSATTLSARLTNTESEIATVTAWMTDPDGNKYNLAEIQQKADDAEASISLVVQEVEGEKAINAASIVAAVNNQTGESTVKLNADSLNLEGYTTINKSFKVDTAGFIQAGGFVITKDSISSDVFAVDDKGILIKDEDGKLIEYEPPKPTRVVVSPGADSEEYTVTVGDDITASNWSFLAGTSFGVKNTGEMYAAKGKIGGCIFSVPTIMVKSTDVTGDDYDLEILPNKEEMTNQFGSCYSDHFVLRPATNLNYHYAYYLDMKIKRHRYGTLEPRTLTLDTVVVVNDDTSLLLEEVGYPSGGTILTMRPIDEVEYKYGVSSNMSKSIQYSTDWYEPENFDTSLLIKKPLFWVKASLYRGNEGDNGHIADLYYCAGNFGSFASIFQFGEDGEGILFSKNSIANQDASIILDGTMGQLIGTWYCKSSNILTSWRGAKHDIESIDDRYSVLFDNLSPVRYKYNDGKSNRYHTGFILDELKTAMDKAGIEDSELAAYCVSDETTGEGGIRYEELIALCVDQIQTLKTQVTELKETVSRLETLIKEKQ